MTDVPPNAPENEPTSLHAGIEHDGLNLVVFDSPEQLKGLLPKIGIRTDAAGRLLDPDGKSLSCASCAKDIALQDIGHIMPGSYHVYCNDPVCILDYLERFG